MTPSEESTDDLPLADELTWRDYLAILTALIQTVALPFLLVVGILLVLFILSILV